MLERKVESPLANEAAPSTLSELDHMNLRSHLHRPCIRSRAALRRVRAVALPGFLAFVGIGAQAADVFDGADPSLDRVTQCAGTNPDAAFFFTDTDGNGSLETMVLLRVVNGHGGIANVGGVDKKIYTFGYAKCGLTATDPANTQPGQLSVRFIDATKPGFQATNPATWSYKTVRSVQVDHAYDSGWACPRPGTSLTPSTTPPVTTQAYAAVYAYRDFNQSGSISAVVSNRNGYRATHAFDDATGVKELYIRTDFCENELNSLMVRATSSMAALPGCFRDDASRALPVQLMAAGATQASCIASATARGFAYAGLQYGGACFAGNVLGYERMADAECSMPCSAAPGDNCGGAWRNRIHATGIAVPAPTPATYLGCYTDAPQRKLPVQIIDSGATRDRCVAAAAARGLRYAGLQYGGQCFGGDVLSGNPAAASNCSTPCTADSGQSCGGTWHNAVHDLGPISARPGSTGRRNTERAQRV